MQFIQSFNNRTIAIILALTTLTLLIVTEPQIGLTWDEPAYIAASESYAAWFGELVTNPSQALSQRVIDQYWAINHEHPPLDKIWSGIIWSGARFMMGDLMAHRLGNMLLVAILVGMLYLLVAKYYGKPAGLFAVAALLALPRFFFHAHLAALDVPAVTMIFATLYFFWRTKDRRGWFSVVGLGVIWGSAVATKVNAVFVMPILFLWMLLFQREWRLFIRLTLAGFLAFPIFVLSWPWLYPAPVARIEEYILFLTVDHWEIGQYYLHIFHLPPPWHFPFAMFFAVIPLTILFCCLIGITRTAIKKAQRPLGTMFILNLVVPMAPLSIGQTMVYDNERLFMPTFVFVAALAGIGLDWLIGGIRHWLNQTKRVSWAAPATTSLIILAYVPHLILAMPLYPHWLSYYSESVGGLAGARQLGFETTYWCETYSEVLPYLNENAERGDVIWVDPWSHDVMVYYQSQGQLRDDVWIAAPQSVGTLLNTKNTVRQASFMNADFVVLQHRETSFAEGADNEAISAWLAEREIAFQFNYRDIPLIEVYQP